MKPLLPAEGEERGDIEGQAFEMPRILTNMFGPDQIKIDEDDDLPPWRQRLTLALENEAAEYDLVVTEDSEYIIFESKVAEIDPPSERLYGVLHDINADTFEGKLVVERAASVGDFSQPMEVDGGVDAIYFTKQIRKAGVPDVTIAEEMSEFDEGLARVFMGVHTAAKNLGLSLEPHIAANEPRFGTHAAPTRISRRRYIINHLGEELDSPSEEQTGRQNQVGDLTGKERNWIE